MVAAAVVLILLERSIWTRDRDTQCEAAQPLIAAGVHKQRVLDTIGQASVEYALTDWPEIEKHFGSDPNRAKMTDIKHRLHERGRLMVYSRSNSIMFVYMSSDGRALHASCFFQ